MRKMLHIQSTDNTDTLIFLDSVQCIKETVTGCRIFLKSGAEVDTTAEFADVVSKIKELYGAVV